MGENKINKKKESDADNSAKNNRKNSKLVLVIIGPQGSGKGTQATLISEKFSVPRISSGDLLRKEVELGTPEGAEAEKYVRKGTLVPTELITDILKARISVEDCAGGFIIDGYPRKLEQAVALDKLVKITDIILIDISDEEAIRRLSSRRQCPKCGRIYGKDIPPAYDNVCDLDGTKLFVRNDDKPEAIRKRLEMYHTEIDPIIEYYLRNHKLIRINGAQKAENVFQDILSSLS